MERQPRPVKVKNKNPANVQITAEQILRETNERQEVPLKVAAQKIADFEELSEHRERKRKEFEDIIRRNKHGMGNWIKYAVWEEGQGEMDRARSVWERALDIDPRNQVLWLRYSEMEMKHKNINRARNIFDRAVSLLPRVDTFWYKYVYMEELLDNVAGVRQVFERWMKWEPAEAAWMAYVKLEKRYKELDRARDIFKRFVGVHPQPSNWIKWAKFEESIGKPEWARAIYEQCLERISDDFIDQNIYVSFAKFETRQKEIERARVIYKYALQKLAKGQAENLYNVYTQFEKQYGAKEGIEDVVVGKRRVRYEDELAANPRNYDVWFDYAKLEETSGDHDKIRDVYERAISNVPPINEKRFWRRYIYLWIFYAVWEELEAKDAERTKQVYQQCLKIIPHKSFTFAKVWLLYAKFLVRQMDLASARKTLGTAIGMAPKERLFKGYIELELQLREFDRVRALYEKYLQWNPANCYAWIKFAELERMLGDSERSRAVFEIAVDQPVLDMPEVLWKGYIDFEVGEEEWAKARALYERLLQRTEHVKVWISYATFESTALDNGETRLDAARKIFNRAYTSLQRRALATTNTTTQTTTAAQQQHLQQTAKEERVILLESWRDFELQHQPSTPPTADDGEPNHLADVQRRFPRAVKKRRAVLTTDADGNEIENPNGGWEEYYDYIFPDDETEKPNFKLLAVAHQWKQRMADIESDSESKDEDEDEDGEGEGEGEKAAEAGKAEKRGMDDDDSDSDDSSEGGEEKADKRASGSESGRPAKRGKWEEEDE
ncbi:uncharacterized protein EV422DRAFT_572167 [Fimicolochytrium jonesii]|uniref:uncharacterized protein n=1 Tax=Fimicolochytrium jonesii TaxID=1396493 RepID=UPI0022FEFB11|nr:uncharacterized protein EV422DRAFT_572167 [Fimicolochytrium jonesii]KAI8816104.1 hypothetical protein EV422DRAFT_572167 [Fimicolochytrium jonesii]